MEDRTRDVGPWRITSSRPLDDEKLLALLREEPRVETADPVSWSDLALLALADENSLTVSRKGSPGFSGGVLADDGRSLAFAEWTSGVLSPRLLLIAYGGPEALERMRRRIDEVRGRAWQGLRIIAVPSGGVRPSGDVVFERANYTFVVSTRR